MLCNGRKDSTREATLTGNALCKVQLKNYWTVYVITMIKVKGTYTSDWQYDANCWHDEGTYDYDLKEAEVMYPDEYELIRLYGDKHLVEGDRPIVKLIEVLEDNLQEEDC